MCPPPASTSMLSQTCILKSPTVTTQHYLRAILLVQYIIEIAPKTAANQHTFFLSTGSAFYHRHILSFKVTIAIRSLSFLLLLRWGFALSQHILRTFVAEMSRLLKMKGASSTCTVNQRYNVKLFIRKYV